jgi:hypothetical protein
MQGYIYILVNPAMQGVVKIGKTTRTPEDRAKELSVATGVPFDFHVGYEKLVKDCDLAENLIQEKLKEKRTAKNREFFTLSLKEAIQAVAKIIDDEQLGISEKTMWDYKFLGQYFKTATDLVEQFSKMEIAWEDAKIHIEKGYIQKWLEETKDFDALVQIHKAVDAKYVSNDDTLIQIIYSVHQNLNFTYLGKEISYKSLYEMIDRVGNNKANDIDTKIIDKLFDGTLSRWYEIYAKVTKQYVNTNFKQGLRFIANATDNSKHNKIRLITILLKWHCTTNDFIYNGTIYYENLDYLILRKEYQEVIDIFILPKYIIDLLKSEDNSSYIKGAKDFKSIHSYLVKKEYVTEEKLFTPYKLIYDGLVLCKSVEEYKRVSSAIIYKASIDKIKENKYNSKYFFDVLVFDENDIQTYIDAKKTDSNYSISLIDTILGYIAIYEANPYLPMIPHKFDSIKKQVPLWASVEKLRNLTTFVYVIQNHRLPTVSPNILDDVVEYRWLRRLAEEDIDGVDDDPYYSFKKSFYDKIKREEYDREPFSQYIEYFIRKKQEDYYIKKEILESNPFRIFRDFMSKSHNISYRYISKEVVETSEVSEEIKDKIRQGIFQDEAEDYIKYFRP